MRCCEGDCGARALPLHPFCCCQLSRQSVKRFQLPRPASITFTLFAMVPDAKPAGAATMKTTAEATEQSQDDAVLAGYRECAMEAMLWLSGLGYESGHPLMRSLAAHLTKRQAYLEKIDLEHFLVDSTLRARDEEVSDDDDDDDEYADREAAFLGRLKEVRNDASVQRFLIEAVFRGCDLRYQ